MGSTVMELLYWRDPRKTGVVFASALLLLVALSRFSALSVLAHVALAILSVTISFRAYKSLLQAVQKTDAGHPFKAYLELEVALTPDQMSSYIEKMQLYLNSTLVELRRLFLVQDLLDSIKFAVLMWLLTHLGAVFNGLTLLILAVVAMFTLPIVYEKNQTQIDHFLGVVKNNVQHILALIKSKVPGAKTKNQ
ncbi:reticulon-1a [Alosa pseudoharengus]|uniref:reticulon-1a n=1 Tax=Alosa pseudoharengus TaxID=34774 RepID=UPI001C09D931|nr:reticulon-1a isoform X1 [Alosa sapidissima]